MHKDSHNIIFLLLILMININQKHGITFTQHNFSLLLLDLWPGQGLELILALIQNVSHHLITS